MADLPEPHFVDRDGATILREIVERLEELLERSLQPSQVERLLCDLIAYRETLVRTAVQEAAKQNLIAYAAFPMIDYLGRLIGAMRLDAQPALTTMQLQLPEALGVPSPIPAGTRFRSKDRKVMFATLADRIIPSGETEAEPVIAACTTLGPLGNGYIAGQVNELVDGLSFELSGVNTTTSAGGAAQEATEPYRLRIPLEVRGRSVAGPEDAYRRIARGAHPDVLDAIPTTPEPGVLRITVLSRTGEETPELLTVVQAACNPKTVRPMNDTVQVVATTRVEYELELALTLYPTDDVDGVLEDASEGVLEYAALLASAHGRSPVKDAIESRARVAGVYSAPLSTEELPVVTEEQVAVCTGVLVTFAGFTSEEPP